MASVKKKNQEVGYYATQGQIEQYCECGLSSFKETGSMTTAYDTCFAQLKAGTLEKPSTDVDAYYETDESQATRTEAGLGMFNVLGSISAIVLGIASFVGGLLGWLLVMRKRVLQCDVCGAVVNAS